MIRRVALVGAIAALLLGSSPIAPAVANPDLFSGASFSLGLKLKDLDSSWRRLTIQQAQPGEAGGFLSLFTGILATALSSNLYYTQGKTVLLGGEPYLLVYRAENNSLDYQMFFRPGFDPSKLPPPPVLTPETPLAASLLKLSSINSLNDIRPFDLQREIADSQQRAKSAASNSAN